MMKAVRIFLFVLVALAVLTAVPVAAGSLVTCAGLDCLDEAYGGGLGGLLAIPVIIFNFLVGISALVLIGVIIWAGIRMMIYHFAESPEAELTAAKLTLTRGIFGFFIVVAAYVIVNTFVYTVLGLRTDSLIGKILCDGDPALGIPGFGLCK